MRHRRQTALATALFTVVAAGLLGVLHRHSPNSTNSTSPADAGAPSSSGGRGPSTAPVLFGALQPTAADAKKVYAAGVRAVVVEAKWAAAEPGAGLDTNYVESLRTFIRSEEQNRLQVVLSPGLQYPPTWVFALNVGTRFEDQYGDVWHGPDGADVADAVWDLAVRRAESHYLSELGNALTGIPLAGIRAGGLIDGELRYPDKTLRDSYWAFDSNARAASPVGGWRPGQPSHKNAQIFLRWYLLSLVRYERFIVGAEQAAFPGVQVDVLYPAWGIRPGQVAKAAAGNLDGASPAERNGALEEGLDWAAQVAAQPKGTTAYLTDLETPARGTGADSEAPINFLAQLARRQHLSLAGENSGGNGPAVLARCAALAEQLHLTQLFWFNEADYFSGRADRPSLTDARAAAASLASSSSTHS